MRRQMMITIEADGKTTVRAMNPDPGHSVQLKAFNDALSGGNKSLVVEHIHDHDHVHGTVNAGHHH